MDRALNYLSLARKGGKAELGEEPVGAVCRTGKAYLVVVASDASGHTWRRAKSFVAGTEQQCIRLPYDKDQLGQSIGRSALAIAAVTDAALALALVQALPEDPAHGPVAAVLQERAQKLRQRQKEAQAHEKNKRKK